MTPTYHLHQLQIGERGRNGLTEIKRKTHGVQRDEKRLGLVDLVRTTHDSRHTNIIESA